MGGVLNYRNEYLSGEKMFLKNVVSTWDKDRYQAVDVGATAEVLQSVLSKTQVRLRLSLLSLIQRPSIC